MGAIVETAVFSQWMQRTSFIPCYARWKNGEVDLVNINHKNNRADWLVEIKWSNRYFAEPNRLKRLIFLCKENNLLHALCTTIDKTGTRDYNNITIQYIPASVYAYNVGKNTLESQK